MNSILILGGTTEGYALAEALSGSTAPGRSNALGRLNAEISDRRLVSKPNRAPPAAHRQARPPGQPGQPMQPTPRAFDPARWRVISSLAGRTSSPRLPAGETRIGGFGGVAGLVDYLREQRIAAVIDATHPFAATMGWHAAEACQALRLPLLRLERPAWQPEPGDRWHLVMDWNSACETLQELGTRRVLLALGRQDLQPFVGLTAIHFLIRCVSPPDPLPAFVNAELLLARGPFDLASERVLLDAHRIDAIVCKNSGGEATAAKLIAAREREIPVVIRQRPERPVLPSCADVSSAGDWLAQVLETEQ